MFFICLLHAVISALRSKSFCFLLTTVFLVLTVYCSTRKGPNDQANYDAIYTVGPILKKIKPRIATLEQTLGLFTSKEHNKTFLMLLYDIGKAGYNVRYKIHNFSTLGLVQERKRLLIIAAR